MDELEDKKQILMYLLAGFVLLVVVAFAFLLFVQSGDTGESSTNNNGGDVSVAEEITTEEVTVTNISASSATVSWYTQELSNGYVIYGESADTLTLEQRNTNTSDKNVHYIDLTNLEDGQTYFFQIKGDNETVVNTATYNFETLSSSEELPTPNTLIVSLPPTFTEGVIYAHASNGVEVSPSASNYAFSSSASIDIGLLTNNGEFTPADAGIRISATGVDGSKYSADFALDVDRADITSANSTTTSYNPNTVFEPITSTASGEPPVEEEPETTPDPEPTPDPTPDPVNEPYPTQNTNSGTVAGAETLPDTALGDNPVRDAILISGIVFVLIGLTLIWSRPKAEVDLYLED